MTLAVDVARAALMEAGRPDLAKRVCENKKGWPMIEHAKPSTDRDIIVKAFLLAHKASGHHRARIAKDLDNTPGILCLDCDS